MPKLCAPRRSALRLTDDQGLSSAFEDDGTVVGGLPAPWKPRSATSKRTYKYRIPHKYTYRNVSSQLHVSFLVTGCLFLIDTTVGFIVVWKNDPTVKLCCRGILYTHTIICIYIYICIIKIFIYPSHNTACIIIYLHMWVCVSTGCIDSAAVQLFLHFNPGGSRANGRCATGFLAGHLAGTKGPTAQCQGNPRNVTMRLFLHMMVIWF
jgi:hypothetical protein